MGNLLLVGIVTSTIDQNELRLRDLNGCGNLVLFHTKLKQTSVVSTFWSSEGRSFVMRSLNPCPENFSQNVVDWGNLQQGKGGEVIYCTKLEVLESNSNLLFLGGGGGNLQHKIGSA